MKKLLSMILALAMIVSVVSVCGGHASAAKALPEGVLYHWGFENDADLTAIEHINWRVDSRGTVTYDLVPAHRDVRIAPNQGVYGSALYLDGTYGVKLKDLEKLDLDAYTISFWVLADGNGDLPPVLQMGSNMIGDPQKGATQSMEFYYVPDVQSSTNLLQVEMYDSEKGAVEFPGVAAVMQPALEDGVPYGEWKLITLVVDGEEFTATDGEKHVGSKLYINDKLVVDASAETESFNAVLPGLLNGENVEGFLGVNYHSKYFRGFIDEMYIFDRALSEDAVKKVLAAGNPANVPDMAKLTPPIITKNPTSETVAEGGNAYFVAYAENYNYVNWYIVSADHATRIPVTSAPWTFAGLTYSGEGTTTLLLSSCPLSLNGWCVEATFVGEGGTSTTSHCPIYVNKAAKPQPTVPAETQTMVPPPDAPRFNGGFFSNNNDCEINLTPAGGNDFNVDISIIRVVGFTGTGTYSDGAVYLTLYDDAGGFASATFYIERGTLTFDFADHAEIADGSSFTGLR